MSQEEVKRLPAEHGAKQLLSVWDFLGTLDDRPDTILLYEGHRIVVPSGAQQKILHLLHLPHSRLVKTKCAATQIYYFVGMTGRIDQMIQGCNTCQMFGSSKPVEPPIQTRPEKRAMERVGMDLFHFGGNTFLVMVDCYSHYLLVNKFG